MSEPMSGAGGAGGPGASGTGAPTSSRPPWVDPAQAAKAGGDGAGSPTGAPASATPAGAPPAGAGSPPPAEGAKGSSDATATPSPNAAGAGAPNASAQAGPTFSPPLSANAPPPWQVEGPPPGADGRKAVDERTQVLEKYTVVADGIGAGVTVAYAPSRLHYVYALTVPQFAPGTEAYMDQIRADMLKSAKISTQEALDIRMASELKEKFSRIGQEIVRKSIPGLTDANVRFITSRLVQEMLGLGNIEYILHDDNIEEICINRSADPIWVYHRKRGWLQSDIVIPREADIWNYTSAIARQVGRQISTRTPLLDAYLTTGDRVNATLWPISVFGNTITIRKFARKPWTITDFLVANTIGEEAAALLWLAMQYELNILVSGGTGAGKTSLLNVLTVFLPPNQRVISIEQTREIMLPSHIQWVPMVVREASAEDRGEVSMLDLMVNSLRMRPDRIIVGEIRRAEEAQVLFEAMHTGHSVYATLHAETVSETVRRLTSPPIELPGVMLESLHLIVAMYRDRRMGIRRVLEVGEILPTDRKGVQSNVIYEWRAQGDRMVEANPTIRLAETIKRYTSLSEADIARTLSERREILRYLKERRITNPDEVSRIIASFYNDSEKTLAYIRAARARPGAGGSKP